MPRVSTWLLPCTCALALGACADGATGRSAAIVNGTPDTTERAIVAVIHLRPTGTMQICTGALLSDHVVLTAKHCVFEDKGAATWEAIPVSALFVRVGDDARTPEVESAVSAVATTPGAYADGAGAVGGDLALLTTTDAITGVPPLTIERDAPTTGTALRLGGYGYTRAGGTGTLGVRHGGEAAIVSVATGTFTSEGATWTCTGDSGGPALVAGSRMVLGVTSIGPRGCNVSTSIYTRLDANLALIDAVLPPPACSVGCDAGTPLSAPDGASGMSQVDAGGGTPAAPRRGGCASAGAGEPGAPFGGAVMACVCLFVLRRRRGVRAL